MARRLAAVVAAVFLVGQVPAAEAASNPGAQPALRAALRGAMSAAGGASGAYVVDLSSGRTLFSSAAGTPRLPASVEKLYTTATALLRFGSDATLQTSVYGVGALDHTGTWNGTLYLRGGGDPTFGSANFDRNAYGAGATMQRLVGALRAAGLHALKGRVVGDESYFDSLRGTAPGRYQPDPYVEGLLSGLAYDRGFADEQRTSFQSHPARFAASQLISTLRAAGVRVPAGTPLASGRTPAGAPVLAVVRSPRMSTLISLTNTPSDNFFAEMLLKAIGARFGAGGSSAAGAAVVKSELASAFGIHPALEDGSGLSRRDATSPRDVATVLGQLATNRDFVHSLAIAGQTGTLADRMLGTPAAGRCEGKTGTLHDVSNLAGYCRATDGHTLAFAFLMNSVDPTAARALQDSMAVALARYDG